MRSIFAADWLLFFGSFLDLASESGSNIEHQTPIKSNPNSASATSNKSGRKLKATGRRLNSVGDVTSSLALLLLMFLQNHGPTSAADEHIGGGQRRALVADSRQWDSLNNMAAQIVAQRAPGSRFDADLEPAERSSIAERQSATSGGRLLRNKRQTNSNRLSFSGGKATATDDEGLSKQKNDNLFVVDYYQENGENHSHNSMSRTESSLSNSIDPVINMNQKPSSLNRRLDAAEFITGPKSMVEEETTMNLEQRSSARSSNGADRIRDTLKRHGNKLPLGRLAKKTDWNALFVKLAKVFLQYFLDLALNDMFGTTGSSRRSAASSLAASRFELDDD